MKTSINRTIYKSPTALMLIPASIACKKEAVKNSLVIDRRTFFTIKIDTKKYTSYGFSNTKNAADNGGPALAEYQKDSLGHNPWVIEIMVYQWKMDNVAGMSGQPTGLVLNLGDCEVYLVFTKKSIADTSYNLLVNNSAVGNNYISISGKKYSVSDVAPKFTITDEIDLATGMKFTNGVFSCNLLDPVTPAKYIPALGSFRMFTK